MTTKDLYDKWTDQKPVELSDSQLNEAFTKVKGKIHAAEVSVMSEILSSELHVRRQKSVVCILSVVLAAACLLMPVVIINVSRHSYDKGLSAQAPVQSMPEICEYSANVGEVRHIMLSDSTSVILNSGSVLICPSEFNGDKRSVYLNGEASFDVTKDAIHPFVVSTSDIDIIVHGTKFNVSSYSDDDIVSTTLCRGSISAIPKNGSDVFKLHPGQRFVVDRSDGSMIVEDVDADEDVAWETGKLCFRSKSIHEIVKILERRYAVRIYITTGKYDDDVITAKFIQGETLDELMSALCKLIPGMTYRKVNSNIYIR